VIRFADAFLRDITGIQPKMLLNLEEIQSEVREYQSKSPNITELTEEWVNHVAKIKKEIEGVNLKANGEILFLGELSPGCKACKEGKWDCIFITLKCNLDCDFCWSPNFSSCKNMESAFGSTPEEILFNLAGTEITGISFSGGEPFLEWEKLINWFSEFKRLSPGKYYWVYTNGLLADEKKIRQLSKLGLNEIRFNVAATGYNHPVVLKNMKVASRFIPSVTIEIPSIPEHKSRVLSNLAIWSKLGVKYLNLHELMYEPDSNSANHAGKKQIAILPDGHITAINPESRSLTLEVMKSVQKLGLSLSVNDCSLQSKIRQLKGRRRTLAPLVKKTYEKILNDEFLESCCAYWNEEKYFFFHSDSINEVRGKQNGCNLLRLIRTVPLGLHQKGKWIAKEDL